MPETIKERTPTRSIMMPAINAKTAVDQRKKFIKATVTFEKECNYDGDALKNVVR